MQRMLTSVSNSVHAHCCCLFTYVYTMYFKIQSILEPLNTEFPLWPSIIHLYMYILYVYQSRDYAKLELGQSQILIHRTFLLNVVVIKCIRMSPQILWLTIDLSLCSSSRPSVALLKKPNTVLSSSSTSSLTTLTTSSSMPPPSTTSTSPTDARKGIKLIPPKRRELSSCRCVYSFTVQWNLYIKTTLATNKMWSLYTVGSISLPLRTSKMWSL